MIAIKPTDPILANELPVSDITDADSILLWFSSQNRTSLGRKPYVFGSETVRFWDGERKGSETVRFWDGERKRETA